MIKFIIEKSIKYRFIVIILTFIILSGGIWAIFNTSVDAIPDLSDVQVIIYTPYKGQSPQVVENQVTYPLTTTMLSVPFAKSVRGYSFFGHSLIYIIFKDGTDIYWARSRVMEYLNFASKRLPKGVIPQIGPDASGVGWAFIYSLTSKNHNLSKLRSIQDWYLKYQLMSVEGVAEVASAGGFVKQYQIELDPDKMRIFNVSLKNVKNAIKQSNKDVGGRLIEQAETEFMVRSQGYLKSLKDLEKVVVGFNKKTGTPIFLKQIARIHLGPEIRRGITELNGKGEVVSGIVIVRYGANVLKTIKRIKAKLNELKSGLPKGVEIHTVYDRSNLILRAINTMKTTLIKELLVVALICIIFLLHIRSAFVAVFVVPAGIIITFIIMKLLGINANIMSLSGIAIAMGVMVDASIVMVENMHKHKEKDENISHLELVSKSAKEVGPALFFSLLVVTVGFLPIFTLQHQEGKLFLPLAYTKTISMAISSILAITIIPVLMYYFVRGKIVKENKNIINRIIIYLYKPIIKTVLKFPVITIVLTVMLIIATLNPLKKIGSEFMPPLNEGDILYMPTTVPGISITKARELLQQTDKIIKKHPQVAIVLGKSGRAETATDPAPLSMLETHIILTPEKTWPKIKDKKTGKLRKKTIEDIIDELDSMVKFPGLTNSWTMPIKTRIDMLSTGIKTPIGIKILGNNLKELSSLGQKIEKVLKKMKGISSVFSERVMGGNYIDIKIDRNKAAQFGLNTGDVQDNIKVALGGINVTTTVEGLERYPVNIRYLRNLRNNIEKLKHLTIFTKSGKTVLLGEIAKIKITTGPPMIKTENSRKTDWIYIDTRNQDIGKIVANAQKLIKSKIKIPKGVSLIWSGQYEYMERAKKKLSLVIPLTVVIIFLLLFVHFKSITESLIVMLTLPFALIGGVWFMYFMKFNFSVAVIVGFIALLGLAAETGIIMLVYIDEIFKQRKKENKIHSIEDLKDIIMEGAVMRVRPKLMTIATDFFAIVPILFINETGSRIMKRIAAPMIGGLFTSTILTLVIIPAIYLLWKRVENKNLFINFKNGEEK